MSHSGPGISPNWRLNSLLAHIFCTNHDKGQTWLKNCNETQHTHEVDLDSQFLCDIMSPPRGADHRKQKLIDEHLTPPYTRVVPAPTSKAAKPAPRLRLESPAFASSDCDFNACLNHETSILEMPVSKLLSAEKLEQEHFHDEWDGSTFPKPRNLAKQQSSSVMSGVSSD